MALHDQVWKEDVIDQAEYTRATAKVLDDWIKRLAYQGAPPELIAKVSAIRDGYAGVISELDKLTPCFPSPHARAYVNR